MEPTVITNAKDTEDYRVKHIDPGGFECGGAHYLTPDHRSDWAWCEPMGIWIRTF